MLSVIQFLNAKNFHLPEIHMQVILIFGGSVLVTRKGIWASDVCRSKQAQRSKTEHHHI